MYELFQSELKSVIVGVLFERDVNSNEMMIELVSHVAINLTIMLSALSVSPVFDAFSKHPLF